MENLIPSLRAFDLETHKIADGLIVPPLVLGSMAEMLPDGSISGKILDRAAAIQTAREYINSDCIIVLANGAFDFSVVASVCPDLLPAIFRMYRERRMFDVTILQMLDAIYGGYLGRDPRTGHIVEGDEDDREVDPEEDNSCKQLRNPSTGKITNRYSLSTVLDLTLGRKDAKEDATFRLSYALFSGVPLHLLPQDAQTYPVSDTENALAAAVAQLRGWARGKAEPNEHGPARNIGNLSEQCEAAFALYLGAAHGLRTDKVRVDALEAEVEEKYKKSVERYQKLGWLREDGTEDQAKVKQAIVLAYGADPFSQCSRCGGSGKVRSVKEEDCRGAKLRSRFQGCLGAACAVCSGTTKVLKQGGEIICKLVAGGCDGTGLDVNTAVGLPRTKKGGISSNRDTAMESGDDDVSDYVDADWQKERTTYLPYLRKGVDHALTLKPNVLLYTGRVSYSDPIQQFPRKGKVRGCVCARPGCYLCSTDYAAGELCSFAQIAIWTVGFSAMADTINETGDPGSLHTLLASDMMGISFEEAMARVKAGDKVTKDFRQGAKAGMFGKGGGMGDATFVLAKRKKSEGFTECEGGPSRDAKGRAGYNGLRFCILLGGAERCGVEKITSYKGHDYQPVCKMCVEMVAQVLTPAYKKRYPEVPLYHKWVSNRIDEHLPMPCYAWNAERGEKEVLRYRGGCNFTSAANNAFQALLADIGKAAYVNITRESYLGVKDDGSYSPLAGSRHPAFMHDEPLSELPIETAHLAGPRIAELMVESGKRLAPDVKWVAEPALMKFWDKDAAHVVDANGKLIVWEPKGAA